MFPFVKAKYISVLLAFAIYIVCISYLHCIYIIFILFCIYIVYILYIQYIYVYIVFDYKKIRAKARIPKSINIVILSYYVCLVKHKKKPTYFIMPTFQYLCFRVINYLYLYWVQVKGCDFIHIWLDSLIKHIFHFIPLCFYACSVQRLILVSLYRNEPAD